MDTLRLKQDRLGKCCDVEEAKSEVEVGAAPSAGNVDRLAEPRCAIKSDGNVLLQRLLVEQIELSRLNLGDEDRQVRFGSERDACALEQRTKDVAHRKGSARG